MQSKKLEISLGILGIGWGIVLLLPLNTYGSSASYTIISSIFSEQFLGLGFLLLGVTKIIAALLADVRMRGFLAACGFFAWMTFSMSMLFSSPADTHWIVYLWIAVISGQHFYELWGEYHRQEVLKR